MKTPLLVLVFGVLSRSLSAAITPVPDKITPVISDVQAAQVPDMVQLQGWMGSRITGNEANRLVKLDPARLLEGYRKRPGRQEWDGEHVGKWLHAATLAWVNSGDPALRAKLDYVAAELCKCQLPDGYLGTYSDKDRWTSWDVWAHKYNLIGLITYMRYTGNLAPMETCRRMGNLLCVTFGDEPGQRDLIAAGYHVGLAPTSVLEPMVLLYRLTGEPRYLDFCRYIVRAWEHPNGPHIVSTLLREHRVDKVGNGKAYEMLSCLNGALEYYRTTGDESLLQAAKLAWEDIASHRLYVTGAASYEELFHADFDLPNNKNVGETCVTVTWLQFNAQLLRLTGEARYAEQLEHVILNQLFGAERPDCAAWGYYVQMEGTKPYSATLDGHCCLSSGPRGVALIPTFAVTTDQQGIVCNLYETGSSTLALPKHGQVVLTTQTTYPADGHIVIKVAPSATGEFTVKLRIPAWCEQANLQVNGHAQSQAADASGYVAITRRWREGDRIDANFDLTTRIITGDHLNAGKIVVMHGPLVLAADASNLPAPGLTLADVRLPAVTDQLQLTAEPAAAPFNSWPAAQVYRVKGYLAKSGPAAPIDIRLVPFADAGVSGAAYRVWLPVE